MNLLRGSADNGVVVGGCGRREGFEDVSNTGIIGGNPFVNTDALCRGESSGKGGHVSGGHVGLAKLHSGRLTNVGECFLVLARIPQRFDSVGWIMDEGGIVQSIAVKVGHGVTQAFPPVA